jgi:hypothetical protein
MYNTVIRPILTYDSSIWIRAINTDIYHNYLRRVPVLALRSITGAMTSNPFDSLNHLTIVITSKFSSKARQPREPPESRLQAYGPFFKHLFYFGCPTAIWLLCNRPITGAEGSY